MKKNKFDEKVLKLRCADRIEELEIRRVVDLCLERCPVDRLLDVGTGSGLFAEEFVARDVWTVGIDPDADMIAAARYYVAGADLLVAQAECLPFIENAFDAVFMGMSLHETAEPDKALQEAWRVSQNRVAVLEWPYPEPTEPAPTARRFKPEDLQAMARKVGFRKISFSLLAHKVLYLLLV
jgi:ubiquinone/menaquinone biosynthesis C-methylase UbiE